MHKLEIKLKQHTPLIHFQHDQEGATLRASEVKPKLDRFILTRLGKGDYKAGVEQAKANGWLVGKGEHPALDYKMRIEAKDFQDIALPVNPANSRNVQQRDEIGRPKFTTSNYPDNTSSLIMSNIGGRIKEEVFNFSLANDIMLTIIVNYESLKTIISETVTEFFGNNSFGNRTSKGFGSFEALSINGESTDGNIYSDSYILCFSLSLGERVNRQNVYKDVFKVIHRLWKALKVTAGVRGNHESTVLLNVNPQVNARGADRIPAPIRFKPIVDFCKEGGLWYCDVNIATLFDIGVIKQVTGNDNTQYYEKLMKRFKDNISETLFESLNMCTKYEILEESVSFE